MRLILFQNSDTQRVVVTLEDLDTVLINKEFRKSRFDDWRIGKGLTIPIKDLIKLGLALRVKDPDKRLKELSRFEILEDNENGRE